MTPTRDGTARNAVHPVVSKGPVDGKSPDERLMLALNKGRIDVIKAVLHDIPDMKFAPPAEFYDGADNEKINRRDRNLERRIKSQQSQEMMQSLKEKITPDQMSRIDDIMMWDSPRKERKDAFRQMTFEEAVDKIVGLDKLSDPERGYLKVRSALLEEKFDIIDAREALEDKWHSLEYKEALPDGWLLVWAMHMAAANGDVELVQELLHRGVWGGLQAFGCCVSPPSSAKCQVNDVLQRAPTLSGMSLRVLIEESTALAALSNDQADVVRLLVSRGLVDRAWALHEAVGGSDMIAQIETLEMLLQEFWRVDPSKLDWNDDAAIQQQLGIDFSLQRGVIGFDGAVDSPYLHTYIGGKKKENHLEILKRYLEWGMSPTCSIKEDPNATLSRPLLHYMMDPLGVKSLKLLLNEGADMMCLNSFKSTALGSAILNRDSMGIAIFSGAMRPKQIAKMIAPVNAARPSEPPRDSRLRRLWRWLSPRARKGYAEEYARYIAKERDFNAPLEDEFGDGFPGLEPGEDIADGTRRVPLVMLMEQNEEAAIKAMDGMMYVQLGYERPGQPIQVNCDFAKVHDSRGSSLRDDIITPYELAVTKRMVNISAHPVMTLLTDTKWEAAYKVWFHLYTALYIMLLVLSLLVDYKDPGITGRYLLACIVLHGVILCTRIASQGWERVQLVYPFMLDAAYLVKVGWNLVRHFKWSGRKARLAQLWNLTVTDTEKKNFVDAFKVSLIPRAFLISYSTPTLLAGLALKATHAGPGHSRGHSRFDAGYLCCCLFWSARCGAKSICQRTGRLSGWSIFLVAASGGYFVTVSKSLGKFMFTLEAIITSILTYVLVEGFLLVVFAGTMYKLRQGDPDVQESESFWEFILVGFYLVIGVDDPDITGFDVRELQPGTKAIVLGFQTLQFIVLINILIAMLSGRYEEIEKRSTQLFRFARHRTVIELESFLPMFLTGNVFPPFGLDDPEVHNDGPMSMAKYFPGGKGLDIDTEPFFNEAGYMATMSWEDWQSLQERRRAYLSSEIDDEAHQYVV